MQIATKARRSSLSPSLRLTLRFQSPFSPSVTNFIQSETKLVKSLLPFQHLASGIYLATYIMNLFADIQNSKKRHVSFFPFPSTLLLPPLVALRYSLSRLYLRRFPLS
jgi:hypothetical protein